jgi:glycosyltransferase involved in cell wall biosynthesis
MLEAMACGAPVAAYPAEGPLEVIGTSRAGVMHENLQAACEAALTCNRDAARARALEFGWHAAARLFASYLVPARGAAQPYAGLANSSTSDATVKHSG